MKAFYGKISWKVHPGFILDFHLRYLDGDFLGEPFPGELFLGEPFLGELFLGEPFLGDLSSEERSIRDLYLLLI